MLSTSASEVATIRIRFGADGSIDARTRQRLSFDCDGTVRYVTRSPPPALAAGSAIVAGSFGGDGAVRP